MDNIVSAAVYVFARNENNQWCILCGKRSGNDPRFQGGLFDVPVGMREIGESPADTAIRETMEETGIKLPPNKLKFIEKQPWGRNNSRMGSNFFCILDECQPIGKGDWEHEGFIWLPIENVDELKWVYGMNNIVKRYFTSYIKAKNMNKKLIRLTEQDLHRIVKESVENTLMEDKMEEATADPRWWQKDGEFPDMKDDAYSRPKQQVKVSEAQLHQIVKESVEQALSEGFFDKFRRTANARDAYKGLDGDYSYNKDKDRFYYHDKYGNKHDTGIGYGKGNVGVNWNPFKFWNSGDRQVTQNDANWAKKRLQHFNDSSWLGKGRKDIDYNGKRAYDNEQERKRQEAWREQQRREEENNQRYRAERPHRIGNTPDQYGHIRAYFDDDAAYDAGLR